jgi:hypothetical protein
MQGGYHRSEALTALKHYSELQSNRQSSWTMPKLDVSRHHICEGVGEKVQNSPAASRMGRAFADFETPDLYDDTMLCSLVGCSLA